MKAAKLFLGMACMAVLTACGNDDEVLVNANQPHEMSITLSTGADTRTTLAEPTDKTGNYGLTRTWKKGDKVTVAYKDESSNKVFETFTLVGDGGSTEGTFTNSASLIPTTGTTNVNVVTNAGTTTITDAIVSVDISTQGDGSITSVGDYEVIWWYQLSVTDGKFGTAKDSGARTFILHIPAGFTVYSGTGSETVGLTVSGTNIGTKVAVDGNSSNWIGDSSGEITLSGIALTDGKLTNDVYVSIIPDSSGYPRDVVLKFGTHEVKLKDPSEIYAGYVYHLSESSKAE